MIGGKRRESVDREAGGSCQEGKGEEEGVKGLLHL